MEELKNLDEISIKEGLIISPLYASVQEYLDIPSAAKFLHGFGLGDSICFIKRLLDEGQLKGYAWLDVGRGDICPQATIDYSPELEWPDYSPSEAMMYLVVDKSGFVQASKYNLFFSENARGRAKKNGLAGDIVADIWLVKSIVSSWVSKESKLTYWSPVGWNFCTMLLLKVSELSDLARKITLAAKNIEDIQLAPGKIAQTIEKTTVYKYQQQQELILKVLIELGYNPECLPKPHNKGGAKAQVKSELTGKSPFDAPSAFDNAWKVLSGRGEIKYC